MVAKENDDDVFGNLLLHAFVFLNEEDEKNTGLLEEEEEEEKVLLALLFIVAAAIRPRSACLIMLISS